MTNQPGGFWRRLAAVLIDGVLVWLVEQAFAHALGISESLRPTLGADQTVSFSHEQIRAHIIIFAIGTLTAVTYATVFYRWKNATLGKLALGLKVVDARTGAPLGVGQAILRESVGRWLSLIPLAAGYLMVPFRRDKRGLHDFISGTQVQRR